MKILYLVVVLLVGCGNSQNENLQKYLIAKGFYLQGDLAKSAKLFKEIYEDDPNFEDADLHMIKIEFYRGNFSESLDLIETALENGRWTQQVLVYKIRVYLLNPEKRNELLPLVDKMLKLDSSNLDALLLAGKVYTVQNKTSEAIMAYNRVLSEADRIRTAHLELSKIYKDLGLNEKSDIHESKAKKIADSSASEVKSIRENILNKLKSKRK